MKNNHFLKNSFWLFMIFRLKKENCKQSVLAKISACKKSYESYIQQKKEDMLNLLLEKDDIGSLKKFLSFLEEKEQLTLKLQNHYMDEERLPIFLKAKSENAVQVLADFGCYKYHEEYKDISLNPLYQQNFSLLRGLAKNKIKYINPDYLCYELAAYVFRNHLTPQKRKESVDYLKFLVGLGIDIELTKPYSNLIYHTMALYSVYYSLDKEKLEDNKKLLIEWIHILTEGGLDIHKTTLDNTSLLSSIVEHKNHMLFDCVLEYYAQEPEKFLVWREQLINNYPKEKIQDYVDKLTPYAVKEEKKQLEDMVVMASATSKIKPISTLKI